ncbi:MAG: hypothetical protein ACTSQ8_16480 [Candidatus Helarchaeota archaeon]
MREIRIRTSNNHDHFDSVQLRILIDVEDEVGMAELNETFWSTCPEIQAMQDRAGRNILSVWIRRHNLLPPKASRAAKGQEDVVILEVVEPYRKFKLYR